jgi:hypothetical protein
MAVVALDGNKTMLQKEITVSFSIQQKPGL